MGKWADEWQMEFNLDKCQVMHFGKLNQGRMYTVNGRALGNVVELTKGGENGIWHGSIVHQGTEKS